VGAEGDFWKAVGGQRSQADDAVTQAQKAAAERITPADDAQRQRQQRVEEIKADLATPRGANHPVSWGALVRAAVVIPAEVVAVWGTLFAAGLLFWHWIGPEDPASLLVANFFGLATFYVPLFLVARWNGLDLSQPGPPVWGQRLSERMRITLYMLFVGALTVAIFSTIAEHLGAPGLFLDLAVWPSILTFLITTRLAEEDFVGNSNSLALGIFSLTGVLALVGGPYLLFAT
jgi:hypothetical protein